MGPKGNSSKSKEKPQSAEERFPTLYARYMSQPHVPSTFVDEEFLRSVGLYEQVCDCLQASRWGGLLTLQCETDVEDTCEFLASFTYEGCSEDTSIRYRHRGEWYQTPMEQVRSIFGWEATRGNWGIYRRRELSDTWSWMTGEQTPAWKASKVSARYIVRPLYFYLQHLLGSTLFGRVNGLDKPNLFEMAIMRDFSRSLTSDYGYYWCIYMRGRRIEGPIRCGGIITYLLRRVHGAPTPPDHQILAPTFLDRPHFSKSKAIKYSKTTGQVAWTYFRDSRLRQEVPRVRRGAPITPPPPPPAEEVFQPQPTQEQLELYFNLARVFQMLFPPGVQWVPAPAGWRVGMAIPEQYIVPGFRLQHEDYDNDE